MEKEPLRESGRFRLIASGIILEVLVLGTPQLGLDIPVELLQTVALSIAGLLATLVYSRTQRNTKN